MKKTLSAIVFAMALLPGCSVKNIRSECPCLLNVEVSGGSENNIDLFCRTGETTVVGHSVLEGNGSKECFEVERGLSTLTVMNGIRSCLGDGRYLRIPFGSEMDEIYACSAQLDTDCDVLDVSAHLHRQYAFLFVSVKGSDAVDYPYYLKISGNICGFDMQTLEPVEGPFSVLSRPFIGTCCRICIPRQKDDSMTIMFFDRTMTRAGSSSVGELPIGKYICSEGYDWTSEDLSDIYIEVDYVKSDVEIKVVPWDIIEL